MHTSINSSLAALRGWMLLEEEGFLIARQDSWQNIRREEDIMADLSKNWTNPDNVVRLNKIKKLLNQLEDEQLVIEHLTHKLENVSSTQVFLNEVDPLASKLGHDLIKVLDFSKQQEASKERLVIHSEMADLRSTFTQAIGNIRAFLLFAEPKFKSSFESNWKKNQESYERLNSLVEFMEPFEIEVIKGIGIKREEFIQFPGQMFASRESKDWNQANYLLKISAVKTSEELISILNDMVNNQYILLRDDSQKLNNRTNVLERFQIGFLIFIVLLTYFLNTTINRKYNIFNDNLKQRRALIDQNVLMATLDKDSRIISISNALCRHLNGVKEDFIGTLSNYFLDLNVDNGMYQEIVKRLLTGKSWQGEFRKEFPDGTDVWFSSTIIPVNIEDKDKDKDKDDEYNIILEDISDRKHFEEFSVTDKLTSLYNRRKFDLVIEHEIKMAKRRKTTLTFAIIDIDFFKKYNDHYGHPAGDSALSRTAMALKSCLSRPDDYVFRLGGEEFGILFSDQDEKQSLEILERLRQKVEDLKIEHCKSDVAGYLTISIGAKVCSGDNIYQKDTLYSEADAALYKAKHSRNTVVLV